MHASTIRTVWTTAFTVSPSGSSGCGATASDGMGTGDAVSGFGEPVANGVMCAPPSSAVLSTTTAAPATVSGTRR